MINYITQSETIYGEQGRVPGSSLHYFSCLEYTISSGRWNCRNYIQWNSCLKFFAHLAQPMCGFLSRKRPASPASTGWLIIICVFLISYFLLFHSVSHNAFLHQIPQDSFLDGTGGDVPLAVQGERGSAAAYRSPLGHVGTLGSVVAIDFITPQVLEKTLGALTHAAAEVALIIYRKRAGKTAPGVRSSSDVRMFCNEPGLHRL